MAQKKVILFFFDRLLDPVIQSNILQYIDQISKQDKSYTFSLITFEYTSEEINSGVYQKRTKKLKDQGIKLIPLKYSQGHPIKKIYCVLQGAFKVLSLRFKGYKHIVTLGTISGSFGYIYSKLFGLKQMTYQYEPHSQFLVETGEWKKSDLPYKILNFLEQKLAKNAKVIASGTIHMGNKLKELKNKNHFFRIPSVVNEKQFIFSNQKRNEIRSTLRINNNQNVFIYVGKFGGIYYYDESFDLFNFLIQKDPKNHVLILSPHNPNEIKKQMKLRNIKEENYSLLQVPFQEVPHYISAADFGLVTIPPTPSQRFRSPIKVGEYLCCGLPYLTVLGVSEDDTFAIKNHVGVVVKEFSNKEFIQAYPTIQSLLTENKKELRDRCREKGISYRGFDQLAPIFNDALHTLTSK